MDTQFYQKAQDLLEILEPKLNEFEKEAVRLMRTCTAVEYIYGKTENALKSVEYDKKAGRLRKVVKALRVIIDNKEVIQSNL